MTKRREFPGRGVRASPSGFAKPGVPMKEKIAGIRSGPGNAVYDFIKANFTFIFFDFFLQTKMGGGLCQQGPAAC